MSVNSEIDKSVWIQILYLIVSNYLLMVSKFEILSFSKMISKCVLVNVSLNLPKTLEKCKQFVNVICSGRKKICQNV